MFSANPFDEDESGVSVRLARPSDKEGLLRLSRMAHGDGYITDYVPGWLDLLLSDYNRILAVAEKDGQIVGFTMTMGGMDGGRTLQGEAGRVHPDLQGTRIMARCGWLGMLHAEKRWPQWYHFRGSSTQTGYYDNNMEKINMITKRAVFRIKLPMSDLSAQLGLMSYTAGISQISASQLENVLSRDDTRSRLYPEGKIILEHSAFNCDTSNIPLIARYHDTIYLEGTDVIPGDSISIGGPMSCDDGRGYRYNFNYSGTANIDTFIGHLFNHLKSCVDHQPQRECVHLITMLPKTLETKYGKEELIGCLKEKFRIPQESITYLHQYVFEYVGIKDRFRENIKFLPKI